MSTTQFRPVRGYEEIIQNQAIVDGNIYFATDSGKIYLDAQGERITMGGNGVGVFYAQASEVRDRGDEVYIMYTSDLESEDASPRENDLIINTDGRFFKILNIDQDTSEIFCSLLAVSGSGGGGGGGGGGGSSVGTISVERITPSQATILFGQKYQIGFSAHATNDAGEVTGNGRYVLYMAGVPKASGVVVQGDNYIDVSEYLALGANTLKVMVYMDVGGDSDASRSRTWTINTTNLTLTWDYDETETHNINDEYEFSWSVSGSSVEKTTHIVINDNYELTATSSSANTQTMKIKPSEYGQHGAYTVKMYVTATIDGSEVVTSTIIKKMIFFDPTNTNPIVSCGLFDLNLRQYNTVTIPIILYDPLNTTGDAVINLKEDGIIVGTLTNVANKTKRQWSYTPMVSGTRILSVQSGLTEVNMIVSIESLNIDINEIGGYAFKFRANEFASNEGVREWSSNDVNATFSPKFDWINGGLTSELDDDGVTRQFVRIKAGSTMTINYPLLAEDAKNTGKVLKCIFKATNCRNYDAQVLECKKDIKIAAINNEVEIVPQIENGTELQYAYSLIIHDDYTSELADPLTAVLNVDDATSRNTLKDTYVLYEDTIYSCKFGEVEKENEDDETQYYIYFNPVTIEDSFEGWLMTAQSATFKSRNNTIATQYCEDAYIELTLDIGKYDNNKIKNYIKLWIDGVPSGFIIYDNTDNFIDYDSRNITIGSPDCDVCLYMLKVYEKGLSNNDHLQNFIADAATAEEMLARYRRNDILDERDEISPTRLALANPDCLVHVYEIDRMTRTKKDKVTGCTYDQYHGSDQVALHADNVTIKVQGTSSEKYVVAAANIDSDFYDTDNGGTGLVDTINNKELGEDGWSMDGGNAIGCNYFCTKVNVASCENANNALNQEWYNIFQPYKTVLSFKQKNARDTMQFTNGVLFMKDKNKTFDTAANADKKLNNLFGETAGYISNPYPKFYSLANMGNSKDNVHVFHDLTNPLECCVEVNDNQTQQQWMVSDDYNKSDIGADEDYFDFRYPDGVEEVQKLGDNGQTMIDGWNNFVSWMAHSNPQPKYKKHTATTEKEFKSFAYNPKTRKDIPVYVKNADEKGYTQVLAFDSSIDTYYTTTEHVHGYTGLLLDAPETYGEYTFRGFRAENQKDDKGELWQKDYTPVIAGCKENTYAGTYTHDTYERRMAKMLAECEDHLIMDSVIYHYLFIEKHCMIDNVAKNTFWSTEDCVHWNLNKDYDNDTADGNDNNGKFTRTYGMEPMDKLNSNTYVFNAHQAVWLNFIHGLPAAREWMYQKLEEKTVKYNGKDISIWSKNDYLALFKEWQSRIPERCWIEDYYRKYFRPYELYNDTMFISMMEGGQKTYQRQQFETYQETYMSSEYGGKDCTSSYMLVRSNGSDMLGYELPVTVYSDCYIRMDTGSDKFVRRVKRTDTDACFVCPTDTLNNATMYFYPAKAFSTIGSLGADGGRLGEMLPEQVSFAQAGKLRELIVGIDTSTENVTLKTGFDVLNNNLLEKLYVANLGAYTAGLDLSKCPNLKEVDATGSTFTNVEIADNAPVTSIKLNNPTSLSLSNLTELEELSITNYGRLKLLNINNIDSSAVNSRDILERSKNLLENYKLTNINWTLNAPTDIDADNNKIKILDTLLTKHPANGETLATSLTGKIFVTDEAYDGVNGFTIYNTYAQDEVYPKLDINFESENAKLYTITIYDGNNKAYWTRNIVKNGHVDATFLSDGPNGAFDINNIYRADTVEYVFEFTKKWKVYGYNTETEEWDRLITEIDATENEGVPYCNTIVEDLHFIPVFSEEIRTYDLTFHDVDGSVVLVLEDQPYGRTRDEFLALAYAQMESLPYKDDSALGLFETYGFAGYGLTATSLTPIADTYFVQAQQEFFPIFNQKSVYDNVLSLDYLEWTESSYYHDAYDNTFNIQSNGATLSIKPEYKNKIRGKVTLPTYVPNSEGILIPVIRLGEEMFSLGNSLDNTILTHVFFEKAKNSTLLRDIGTNCFAYCSELQYVELPASLRTIQGMAFFACHKLSLTSELNGDLTVANNICHIYAQAFCAIQGSAMTDKEIAITIGSEVRSLGITAFANINRYIKSIVIGTPDKGSKLTASNIDEQCFKQNDSHGEWSMVNAQVTIYIADTIEGQRIADKLYVLDNGSTYSNIEIIQTAT